MRPLDVERRRAWNELRRSGNPEAAKKFKGARWALLKKPTNLIAEQAATLRKLKRRGGDVWHAYMLNEAFRAIFAGDLDSDQVTELIDRWISRASRSSLCAFVKAARTIRKFRDGLLAAIQLNINNGRAEGLNNVVRLNIRRARGFVPQPRGSARPGHALLRTHHPPPTPRTTQHSPRMTHTHAGRAVFSDVRAVRRHAPGSHDLTVRSPMVGRLRH